MKNDVITERLAWLRMYFGLVALIDVSLSAWLVQNYGAASATLTVGALILIAGFSAYLLFLEIIKRRLLAVMEAKQ